MRADIFFKEKLKEIAKEKRIFDIGGGEKKFQGLEQYSHYFQNSDYKTIDIRGDFHPDIIADVHDLPIEDAGADAVICKSVLQFAHNPHGVADEIFRVLRAGGKCFVYVPFIYPYHGDGEKIKDYWRFSVDAVYALFSKFQRLEICPVKGQFEAAANVLPFQKGLLGKFLIFFAMALDHVTYARQSGKQAAGYFVYLEK